MVLEFEASIRLQYQVDSILENGIQDKQAQEEILYIFEELYPKWQTLVTDEQQKEEQVYKSGEGAYLRLFSPCWVYTRIIYKATLVLGRLKMYSREHSVLTKLLGQRLFIYPKESTS
jgi:Fanconi-associated nuclease 1